jgi:adenosylcobinamide-phosphate synthase
MLLHALLGQPAPLDPLLLLLAALLLDAYIGGGRFLFGLIPHPVAIIGAAVAWLERKLNREQRPEGDRVVRGALVAALVIVACAAAGLGVSWLTLRFPYAALIEVFLVTALIAQRSLFDHVRAVGRALNAEGLEAGRAAVAHIVGRDVRLLDGHGVARAAIESCAENYSDAVVGPTFWYVLFGFPGLLVYKAVNTMDSMIGHRSPRYRAFGKAAARIDDAANLIPARLAGVFLCMAAMFVPTARPLVGLRVMLRDAGKHRSVNAGWPEGAAAGALGLALAGPRKYTDSVVDDPWIGNGRARATARDIDRALYLYTVACLINAFVVAALVAVRVNLD